MSVKLAGHLFTGPFPVDATEVRANNIPVVYAIIAKAGQAWAPTFRLVDVGASPDQGLRFADHPQRAAWEAPPGEAVSVYLLNMPRGKYAAQDRERLAEEIRRQYDRPRGMIN
jgi:hypothetical protein